MQINPFSSIVRPAICGRRGAIAAAHPLAAAAGQHAFAQDGSAADAVIAAQAMLAVVSPDACGLGGDGLVLVRATGQAPVAINGAGAAAAGAKSSATTGGASVAVPGLVDAWCQMQARWGRLDLRVTLAPAISAAQDGVPVTQGLAQARRQQSGRLMAGGAGGWALMGLESGDRFRQPALAQTLRNIADNGRDAFYLGPLAAAIAHAVQQTGGSMTVDDLAAPAAVVASPISMRFGQAVVQVQPPASQGVLLALALHGWLRGGFGADAALAHLGVELTQAAFALRDDVSRGAALLDDLPAIDPVRAAGRGGPRSYLHTAGVAAADPDGLVMASLISVFDDFGSAVFVPEGGFTLNNRAGGLPAAAMRLRRASGPFTHWPR